MKTSAVAAATRSILMFAIALRCSKSGAFVLNRTKLWSNNKQQFLLHSNKWTNVASSSRRFLASSSSADIPDDDQVITQLEQKQKNDTTAADTKIITEQLVQSRRARALNSLRRGTSSLFSAGGFVASTTRSIFSDRLQWDRLRLTAHALQTFLHQSGIHAELTESLNRKLLDHLVILARVQQHARGNNDVRTLVASKSVHSHVQQQHQDEWFRYMRYATAVYGQAMIRAAEMNVSGKFDNRLSPLAKTKISEHIQVPEQDIAVMDVEYDGDGMHLRHFVAVDHEHRKVVLAIRGTFNLAEIVTDVAAFTCMYAFACLDVAV
jgi:hypothetical protein